jgi:multiple sugar transport system ATP-binding protein
VAVLEELGAETHVIFWVDASPVATDDTRTGDDEDERAQLLADDQRSLFTASVDARTRARPGTKLRLAIDPRMFHFFDPDTGKSLRAPGKELAGVEL